MQGVIFDLDGVLVSTDELHYQAWKKLADELGITDFNREDNVRQRGVSRMAVSYTHLPIATISGRECCNLWQHASLQLQASTAVAYGVWFYEKMFDDKDFLKKYGLEMLIEISRMLATRGDFNREGKYGYYCVMGPDEFQMMVHNNSYTNYMAKFTLEYTLDKINEIKAEDPDAYKRVADKVAFDESEMDTWKNIKENMILLYDDETKLFEQHDGFFKDVYKRQCLTYTLSCKKISFCKITKR